MLSWEQFNDRRKIQVIVDKYIKIVCGCIVNDNTVLLELVDGNLEYGEKYTEISIWSNDKTKPTFSSTIIDLFIRHTVKYKSIKEKFDGVCLLTGDNDIIFFQDGNYHKEKIKSLRSNSEINSLAVIDGDIWACGDNAEVYRRVKKNQWIPVDDDIRIKYTFVDIVLKAQEYEEKRARENVTAKNAIIEWMTFEQFKYSDYRKLWRICGSRRGDIYACGSINTDKSKNGVLFHFDGLKWRKLDIPQTTTLCAIYIDDDSVFVGGQEGHLLKSLDGIHFQEISRPHDLMNIGTFAKYDNRIYIGSDSGLFQCVDNKITAPDIADDIVVVAPEILSDSVSVDKLGDYLLLTTTYSVYRYCFNSRVCELLLKFTGHPSENIDNE